MKKELTIEHFTGVIPMAYIHEVMVSDLGNRSGEAKYRRLDKWLSGQTLSIHGMYEGDLERFLIYDNKGKEAPIYD